MPLAGATVGVAREAGVGCEAGKTDHDVTLVLLDLEGDRKATVAMFQARLPHPACSADGLDHAGTRPGDDMIPAVQTALNSIVGRVTTLDHASGAGRIFELFVVTSLARGLRDAGFSVWLQRSDGTIIRPGDADRRFVQRGGAPTGVPAASAGPSNASVIGFRWGRRRKWEIWNGIQFAGRSAVTHEIDIRARQRRDRDP